MKKDNKIPPKMPELKKKEYLNISNNVWDKTHKSKNKHYFIAASISSLFIGTIVISSLQEKTKVSLETSNNKGQKIIETQNKIQNLKRYPANTNNSLPQEKNNYKYENQLSSDEKLETEYVKQVNKTNGYKTEEHVNNEDQNMKETQAVLSFSGGTFLSNDNEDQNMEETQEDIIEYQDHYEQNHVNDYSYLDEEYAESFNSNQEN